MFICNEIDVIFFFLSLSTHEGECTPPSSPSDSANKNSSLKNTNISQSWPVTSTIALKYSLITRQNITLQITHTMAPAAVTLIIPQHLIKTPVKVPFVSDWKSLTLRADSYCLSTFGWSWLTPPPLCDGGGVNLRVNRRAATRGSLRISTEVRGQLVLLIGPAGDCLLLNLLLFFFFFFEESFRRCACCY